MILDNVSESNNSKHASYLTLGIWLKLSERKGTILKDILEILYWKIWKLKLFITNGFNTS